MVTSSMKRKERRREKNAKATASMTANLFRISWIVSFNGGRRDNNRKKKQKNCDEHSVGHLTFWNVFILFCVLHEQNKSHSVAAVLHEMPRMCNRHSHSSTCFWTAPPNRIFCGYRWRQMAIRSVSANENDSSRRWILDFNRNEPIVSKSWWRRTQLITSEPEDIISSASQLARAI